MKERPILFSGPMVIALLDNRKTQTRRIVKPQPHEECGPIEVGHYHPTVIDRHGDEQPGDEIFGAYSLDGEWGAKCPYGVPGDRLWVRETHLRSGEDVTYSDHEDYDICYPTKGGKMNLWRVVSAIHMPRDFSRLTLELTGVRVERVQDISGDDAIAEGVQVPVSEPNRPLLRLTSRVPFALVSPKPPREWGRDEYARFEFLHLFYDINRRAAVDANPWVWVLEFTVAASTQGER